MIEKIEYLQTQLNIKTHAFVLMPNHYHWVLSTPDFNLSAGMTYFHREVARAANRKSNRMNHFFGGRYKWCSMQSEIYYWNVIKYVFRNPVKANICKRVEDYTFSSLNIKSRKNLFHLCDFFNDPETPFEPSMYWLNETFNQDVDFALGRGLRRRVFQLPKNKNSQVVELPRDWRKRDLVPN